MNTTVVIDGRAYDVDELAAVLTVMLPDRYPDLWDHYYRAWRYLDRRERSRK